MALTDLAIRKLKPTGKAFKRADRDGLYLYVTAKGARYWRCDYSFAGKRRTASLGTYPAVTLADARQAREGLRRKVAAGDDPALETRLAKIAAGINAENTFASVRDEYLGRLKDRHPPLAPATVNKKTRLLETLPGHFTGRPIADIKAAEVLAVLQTLEAAGRLETAHATRGAIGEIFRYAVVTLRAENDPTQVLRGAILSPRTKPMAAIVDEAEFGKLMIAIDESGGWGILRAAMKFTALTMCRPGEVRGARWSEIDLEAKRWTIPAERMKMRREHAVPLSKQALAVLREARAVDPYSELVFPSLRTNLKPLSENAMNSALRRMGYTKEEMTSHGFRSSASFILNGRGLDGEIIELCLAHADSNVIRRTYNRAQRWPERVALMQKWGNIIDALKLA